MSCVTKRALIFDKIRYEIKGSCIFYSHPKEFKRKMAGSGQFSRLPYRPGDKNQLKAQDVTAKLVRSDILRKVPKNILFCINSLTPKSVPGSGGNEKLSLGRLFAS